MKRTIVFSLTLATVFSLTLATAIHTVEAATIESMSIPTNGSTVSSSTVLNSGSNYVIEASGTFIIGGPGDGLADADYFNFSNPPASVRDLHSNGLDLGMSLNGGIPDWGPFDATHIYTKTILGNDQSLRVSYVDTTYSDNRGSLNLTISAIPIPPAVWLFGSGLLGLIGIARRRGYA